MFLSLINRNCNLQNFIVCFQLRVDDDLTANHFGHNEASDGNVVTGEYRVLLPDGRTQIVRSVENDVIARIIRICR